MIDLIYLDPVAQNIIKIHCKYFSKTKDIVLKQYTFTGPLILRLLYATVLGLLIRQDVTINAWQNHAFNFFLLLNVL